MLAVLSSVLAPEEGGDADFHALVKGKMDSFFGEGPGTDNRIRSGSLTAVREQRALEPHFDAGVLPSISKRKHVGRDIICAPSD